MYKFISVDDYRYKLVNLDNWKITEIIYKDAYGKSERVEVTDETRPIINDVKRFDENRIAREKYNRKRATGKQCANYSECNQCGECAKFYKSVKRNNTNNPTHAALERKEQKTEIRNAIKQLPAKQKTVIRQKYFNDIAAVEIARNEGLSKSSVSHIEKRALENLKKLLSRPSTFPA